MEGYYEAERREIPIILINKHSHWFHQRDYKTEQFGQERAQETNCKKKAASLIKAPWCDKVIDIEVFLKAGFC